MSDPTDEERRASEVSRRLSLAAPDPDAAGLARWAAMPPEARAAGCLQAMLQRWPIAKDQMRYNPITRVVHVVQPDPLVANQRKAAGREVPRNVDDVLATIRAQFGNRAEEVLALIRRS